VVVIVLANGMFALLPVPKTVVVMILANGMFTLGYYR
jgi:hypothetical protein